MNDKTVPTIGEKNNHKTVYIEIIVNDIFCLYLFVFFI